MSKKLATKEYVDKNVSKPYSYNFKDASELNSVIAENEGRMLHLVNTNNITINNITIPAWSQIFVPSASSGDMVGIIMYPYADSFWILGHTAKDGWLINKVF